MDFLISNVHISPVYLVVIGFIIGLLGGFFGVGGSFLAGPGLFAVGVPMNFVVGTDLAHIVGKSIVAAKKHRALGNVDIKLGTLMAWEGWRTTQRRRNEAGSSKASNRGRGSKADDSAFDHIAQRIHRIKLP